MEGCCGFLDWIVREFVAVFDTSATPIQSTSMVSNLELSLTSPRLTFTPTNRPPSSNSKPNCEKIKRSDEQKRKGSVTKQRKKQGRPRPVRMLHRLNGKPLAPPTWIPPEYDCTCRTATFSTTRSIRACCWTMLLRLYVVFDVCVGCVRGRCRGGEGGS